MSRARRLAHVPLAVLVLACQSENGPHVAPVAGDLRVARLRLDKVP